MRDHVSIGDLVQEGEARAFRWLTKILLGLVYLAGLGYSAVHQWRLLSRGVEPELLVWATLGIVGLELMAIALPLGLHYSFFDPNQRVVALLFYVLDLGLVFVNVGVSFTFVGQGRAMPAWVELYSEFVLPATPIIAMTMATALALLDPGARMRAMAQRVRVAAVERLTVAIAQAAAEKDVEELVQEAGGVYARTLVRQGLGIPVAMPRRGVEVATVVPEGVRPNGAYQPKPEEGEGFHLGEA